MDNKDLVRHYIGEVINHKNIAAKGTAMKIGIIGAGNMGTTLGDLWIAAGHDVLYGTRASNPTSNLRARPIAEACALSDFLVLAVNYWTIESALREMGDLTGKIILDISNPFALKAGATDKHNPANFERVLPLNQTALDRNRAFTPQAVWVKAFCSLPGKVMRETHHQTPHIAIPYTAADSHAADLLSILITDAGFDPVYAGGLDKTADIELLGKLSMQPMTKAKMLELMKQA
ncbi:MAG TPA: NAD(P)-binding domain-containing protein [Anaerolineales bacterium]|nr:NAD(P)-binding domain-containing protein [Anaerolineales bacterium]